MGLFKTSPCLLREEINSTYDAKIFTLNRDDPTCEAQKKYYQRGEAEDLDAVDTYEKKQKSKEKRNLNVSMKKYQITDSLDPQKTKVTLGFNNRESASIKSFTVKKTNEIKVALPFMFGELLMFAML